MKQLRAYTWLEWHQSSGSTGNRACILWEFQRQETKQHGTVARTEIFAFHTRRNKHRQIDTYKQGK